MKRNSITIRDVQFGLEKPLAFILGPCQIESRDHSLMMADKISKICKSLNAKFIFKSSYDKANRSSFDSARGVGLYEGLRILEEVKNSFGCPVITDVHESVDCTPVAEVVDVIQIPAFLCRQTDLLIAAGQTGKAINIKKGQFMAPWEMKNVVNKVSSTGNSQIMLCERGTTFGYNTLVNDFRGLEIMAETGCPVIFDATHSVQQPGGLGNSSGGERKYVASLARAAVAVGVAGVFIETHQDPDNAPCDGPNMIDISNLSGLLSKLIEIHQIARNFEIGALSEERNNRTRGIIPQEPI